MPPFMNLPHLHLLMNHVPTVGTVVAVGLFILALARRNEHLKHAALEVFFLIALVTLPVYLTGVAAQLEIQGRPDVSRAAIAAHHDAALLSFILMMLTGFVSWLSLWQFRRHGRPPAGRRAASCCLPCSRWPWWRRPPASAARSGTRRSCRTRMPSRPPAYG